MSEPLKIYQRGGGEIENPDPELERAAQIALYAHRHSGRPRIEFVPLQQMPHYDPAREHEPGCMCPIFYIENPDYRTYP